MIGPIRRLQMRLNPTEYCKHGRRFPTFGCPGCNENWRRRREARIEHTKGLIKQLEDAGVHDQGMADLLRWEEADLAAGPPLG